jgi:hypothetical protein
MMMIQIQKTRKITILYLLIFIVWKPSVLHVVGAVQAWTLFDIAESSTNILNFLEAAYPTADVRPDYDKGCQVLHTTISNKS